jgi:hypothetical protein
MRQALPRQFTCLGPIRSAPHLMSFPTQYETPPREEVRLTIDEQDSVHPGPPSVYALRQLVRPTSKTCSRREPLTGGVTPCLRFWTNRNFPPLRLRHRTLSVLVSTICLAWSESHAASSCAPKSPAGGATPHWRRPALDIPDHTAIPGITSCRYRCENHASQSNFGRQRRRRRGPL